MPIKDDEERRRRDKLRKARKRALERGEEDPGAPPVQTRDQVVQGRLADERRAVDAATEQICRVVEQVSTDRIDQQILKDRLIRELYPDVNEAVLRVLRNLGLTVDCGARLGVQLVTAAIEPLVARSLRQLGPVQASEIPRLGSMDPAAIAEMKLDHADTAAVMVEMGRRKLLMTDPSTLTIQEARWLIQTGAGIESRMRQRAQEEDAENTTRKFVDALMDDPKPGDSNENANQPGVGGLSNIELVNELLVRVDAAFGDPTKG